MLLVLTKKAKYMYAKSIAIKLYSFNYSTLVNKWMYYKCVYPGFYGREIIKFLKTISTLQMIQHISK